MDENEISGVIIGMIEGQAVPILSTDQYARVPSRWMEQGAEGE